MDENNQKKVTKYSKIVTRSMTFLGLFTSIFYLFSFSIGDFILWPKQYYAILILCFLPQAFLLYPRSKSVDRFDLVDYLFAFTSALSAVYIIVFANNFEMEGWEITPPWHAVVIGVAFCIQIFEACRRISGKVFTIIALIFFTYPLYAENLPSFLMGRQVDFIRAIGGYFCGNIGPFGIPMRVVGDILIGFLFFAVVLMVLGGGEFFLKLASSLLGKSRGGPAKVAVISSAFFSSMSGSVVANVATTGCVTIPAMKKTGYPAHYAAAIEACASTGGTLMPPIMGATAFIMCTLLGVSYSTVALAAVIPSCLYYMTLLIQVDAFAAKNGFKGLSKEEIPNLRATLIEGWPYLVSIGYLVYGLIWLRAVATTPFFASGLLLILTQFNKNSRITQAKLAEFTEQATRTIGEILVILLAVGFIIGGLTITGTANAFAREIVLLTSGNQYLLLLFGALTSFVLGMGMTVTACYVFLAVTMAPPLIEIGYNPLAVHLFVMYYGMVSYITPPVALGSFAAASIAGSEVMKTAIYSTKMGIAIFAIPFMFVGSPELILQGNVLDTITSLTKVVIGLFLLSSALEGYMIGIGKLRKIESLLFIIGGALLTIPYVYVNIAGIALLIIAFVSFLLKKYRQKISTQSV